MPEYADETAIKRGELVGQTAFVFWCAVFSIGILAMFAHCIVGFELVYLSYILPFVLSLGFVPLAVWAYTGRKYFLRFRRVNRAPPNAVGFYISFWPPLVLTLATIGALAIAYLLTRELAPLRALTVIRGEVFQTELERERAIEFLRSKGRLKFVNLRDANLSNAKFEESDLSGANLSGANLSRSILSGTTLIDANLRRANLGSADLSKAKLGWADLRDARLDNAVLHNANLRHATLSYADLHRADLRAAILDDSNLTGANLIGANLHEASLDNASLRNADLRGANLRQARGLSPAQVIDAIWDSSTTWPEGFSPAPSNRTLPAPGNSELP